MALVNNGVKISIPKSLQPAGFTYPSYTPMAEYEYCREFVLTIDKATVENADPVLTLQQIFNNAVIGVEKQVTDILTADYIGTNTVEYLIEAVGIGGNICPSLSNDFYLAVAPVYTIKAKVYIQTS